MALVHLPHLNPDLEEPPPALRRRFNRRPRLARLQRLLAVGRIDPLRRLRLAQLRRPDDNRLTIKPLHVAITLYP